MNIDTCLTKAVYRTLRTKHSNVHHKNANRSRDKKITRTTDDYNSYLLVGDVLLHSAFGSLLLGQTLLQRLHLRTGLEQRKINTLQDISK